MNALRIIGRDADDDAGVGMRGEIFHRIFKISATIDGVRSRIADVKPTTIIAGNNSRVHILNRELSQRLIILRKMSLHLPLQTVCLPIIVLSQSFTDSRNRLMCIRRINVHVARLARPQRDVIQ